jgi:hypothetical protein
LVSVARRGASLAPARNRRRSRASQSGRCAS